jgi:tyrosine-protein kinase Etk/Wzc
MINEVNQKQNSQCSEHSKPVDAAQDILNLLNIIRHHWIIIVSFTIVGLMAGLTYSRYSRNLFECTTMLQLDTKSKNAKAIVDIGDLFQQQSPAKAEILLIQSMSVMLPVVEKLHLNYTAEPLGIIDRLLHREGRMDLKLFEPPKPKDDEKIEWITEILSDSTYDF